METEIEQRQCNRFVVLYEVYKEAKADTTISVKVVDLAAAKGVKNGIFKEALAYLVDEGFLTGLINHKGGITILTPSCVMPPLGFLTGLINHKGGITHEGVKIVEYIITHPNDSTDLFPAFKEMGI